MRSVHFRTAGAAALALLLPTAVEAASGVVNGTVNLREGPGTNFAVVTTIPTGSSVEILSCEGWCELRFGEYTGWASARYVTADSAAETAAPEETTEPEVTVAEAEVDTVSLASTEDVGPGPLTEDELEVLVAPIALYPDDLVALIIAASLYPVDIVKGARFLDDLEKDPKLEPSDDWDGSVISLLNYPDIVKMMSEDLDWTQLLGEAAVSQQKDLLVAIQQLRDQAVATEVLQSTEQVVVTNENDNVVIKSADPEVVYVPTYEPQMLYDPGYVSSGPPIYYSDPYPSYWSPTAGFWTAAVTGAAFAAAVDWDNWGTWGGDVDIDVKREGDKVKIDFGDRTKTIERGDLNIDRDKMNINRDNLRNVDRSNIQVGNVDRSQISRDLQLNNKNRVNNPGKITQARPSQRPAAGTDIRKNVQSGLSQRPTQRPTTGNVSRGSIKPSTPQARPDISGGRKPTASRPTAKDRPAASRPTAKSRPTASKAPNRPTKSVSSRKPGGATANRSSKPSAIGGSGRGKPTQVRSNRGGGSRGGGMGGGGRGGGGGGGGRRR